MANDYVEGTLEWHAWGAGNDYGILSGIAKDEMPLSGEWADGVLIQDVIRAAWQAILGAPWDTYTDGDDEDRDADEDILNAWEQGYRDAFND